MSLATNNNPLERSNQSWEILKPVGKLLGLFQEKMPLLDLADSELPEPVSNSLPSLVPKSLPEERVLIDYLKTKPIGNFLSKNIEAVEDALNHNIFFQEILKRKSETDLVAFAEVMKAKVEALEPGESFYLPFVLEKDKVYEKKVAQKAKDLVNQEFDTAKNFVQRQKKSFEKFFAEFKSIDREYRNTCKFPGIYDAIKNSLFEDIKELYFENVNTEFSERLWTLFNEQGLLEGLTIEAKNQVLKRIEGFEQAISKHKEKLASHMPPEISSLLGDVLIDIEPNRGWIEITKQQDEKYTLTLYGRFSVMDLPGPIPLTYKNISAEAINFYSLLKFQAWPLWDKAKSFDMVDFSESFLASLGQKIENPPDENVQRVFKEATTSTSLLLAMLTSKIVPEPEKLIKKITERVPKEEPQPQKPLDFRTPLIKGVEALKFLKGSLTEIFGENMEQAIDNLIEETKDLKAPSSPPPQVVTWGIRQITWGGEELKGLIDRVKNFRFSILHVVRVKNAAQAVLSHPVLGTLIGVISVLILSTFIPGVLIGAGLRLIVSELVVSYFFTVLFKVLPENFKLKQYIFAAYTFYLETRRYLLDNTIYLVTNKILFPVARKVITLIFADPVLQKVGALALNIQQRIVHRGNVSFDLENYHPKVTTFEYQQPTVLKLTENPEPYNIAKGPTLIATPEPNELEEHLRNSLDLPSEFAAKLYFLNKNIRILPIPVGVGLNYWNAVENPEKIIELLQKMALELYNLYEDKLIDELLESERIVSLHALYVIMDALARRLPDSHLEGFVPNGSELMVWTSGLVSKVFHEKTFEQLKQIATYFGFDPQKRYTLEEINLKRKNSLFDETQEKGFIKSFSNCHVTLKKDGSAFLEGFWALGGTPEALYYQKLCDDPKIQYKLSLLLPPEATLREKILVLYADPNVYPYRRSAVKKGYDQIRKLMKIVEPNSKDYESLRPFYEILDQLVDVNEEPTVPKQSLLPVGFRALRFLDTLSRNSLAGTQNKIETNHLGYHNPFKNGKNLKLPETYFQKIRSFIGKITPERMHDQWIQSKRLKKNLPLQNEKERENRDFSKICRYTYQLISPYVYPIGLITQRQVILANRREPERSLLEMIPLYKSEQVVRTIDYFKKNSALLRNSTYCFECSHFILNIGAFQSLAQASLEPLKEIVLFFEEILEDSHIRKNFNGYATLVESGLILSNLSPEFKRMAPNFREHLREALKEVKDDDDLELGLQVLIASHYGQDLNSLDAEEKEFALIDIARLYLKLKVVDPKSPSLPYRPIVQALIWHWKAEINNQLDSNPLFRNALIRILSSDAGWKHHASLNHWVGSGSVYQCEEVKIDLRPILSLDFETRLYDHNRTNGLVKKEEKITRVGNSFFYPDIQVESHMDKIIWNYEGKRYLLCRYPLPELKTTWIEITKESNAELLVTEEDRVVKRFTLKKEGNDSYQIKLDEKLIEGETFYELDLLEVKHSLAFLSWFEDLSAVKAYCSSNDLKKIDRLECPNFELTFVLKEDKMCCVNRFPGFYISRRQSLPSTVPFTKWLLLENDLGEQKILVPKQLQMGSLIRSLLKNIIPSELSYVLDSLYFLNKPSSLYAYGLDLEGNLMTEDLEAIAQLFNFYLVQNNYKEAMKWFGRLERGGKIRSFTSETLEQMNFSILLLIANQDDQWLGMGLKVAALREENQMLNPKKEKSDFVLNVGEEYSVLKPLSNKSDLIYLVLLQYGYKKYREKVGRYQPLTEKEEFYLLKSIIKRNSKHMKRMIPSYITRSKMFKVVDYTINLRFILKRMMMLPELVHRYYDLAAKEGIKIEQRELISYYFYSKVVKEETPETRQVIQATALSKNNTLSKLCRSIFKNFQTGKLVFNCNPIKVRELLYESELVDLNELPLNLSSVSPKDISDKFISYFILTLQSEEFRETLKHFNGKYNEKEQFPITLLKALSLSSKKIDVLQLLKLRECHKLSQELQKLRKELFDINKPTVVSIAAASKPQDPPKDPIRPLQVEICVLEKMAIGTVPTTSIRNDWYNCMKSDVSFEEVPLPMTQNQEIVLYFYNYYQLALGTPPDQLNPQERRKFFEMRKVFCENLVPDFQSNKPIETLLYTLLLAAANTKKREVFPSVKSLESYFKALGREKLQVYAAANSTNVADFPVELKENPSDKIKERILLLQKRLWELSNSFKLTTLEHETKLVREIINLAKSGARKQFRLSHSVGQSLRKDIPQILKSVGLFIGRQLFSSKMLRMLGMFISTEELISSYQIFTQKFRVVPARVVRENRAGAIDKAPLIARERQMDTFIANLLQEYFVVLKKESGPAIQVDLYHNALNDYYQREPEIQYEYLLKQDKKGEDLLKYLEEVKREVALYVRKIQTSIEKYADFTEVENLVILGHDDELMARLGCTVDTLRLIKQKIFLYQVTVSRWNVIFAALEKGNIQEIALALASKRVYDFNNEIGESDLFLRSKLAFESRSGKLLWEKPMRQLDHMLHGHKKRQVLELIMGSGKTTYGIPTTDFILSDEEHLVVNVWPEALFKTNVTMISSQLHRLFGQTSTALTLHRKMGWNLSRLEAILMNMNRGIQQKEPLNITKEDAQALELKWIETGLLALDKGTNKKDIKKLEILQKILKILRKEGRAVPDETHEIFYCHKELNYPMGKMHTLKKSYRRIIEEVMLHLATDPRIKPYIPLKAEKWIQVDVASYELIVPYLVENMLHYRGITIEPENREAYAEYIMGKTHEIPSFINEHEKKSEITLLKGVITYLLPFVLKGIIHVNFCSSKNEEEDFAKPSEGNETPLEHSLIRNPFEAYMKTCMMLLHKGLTATQARKFLIKLSDDIQIESNLIKCSFEQTLSGRFFQEICPGYKIGEVSEEACQQIRKNDRVILEYVHKHVGNQIKYYEYNLSSNSQNFASMFSSFYSGTGSPYNHETYPEGTEMIWDKGTLGESIDLLESKCGHADGVQVLHSENPKAVLNEILQTYFSQDSAYRAIIDRGALFRGLSNYFVASKIVDHLTDLQGVVFFNDDKELMIWEKGFPNPIPLAQSMIPKEKRVTYYDQSHTFGADIPQGLDALAVLTVGEDIQLSLLAQSLWRMRLLKSGNQSVTLVMTPSVQTKMGKEKPTIRDVILFGESNEREELQKQNFQSDLQKVHDRLRRFILDKMLALDPHTSLKVLEEFRDFLCVRMEDDPFKLYANTNQSMNPNEILKNYCKKLRQIVKHSYSFDEEEKRILLGLLHDVPQGNYSNRVQAFSDLGSHMEVEDEHQQQQVANANKNTISQKQYTKEPDIAHQPWPKIDISNLDWLQEDFPLYSLNKILAVSSVENLAGLFSPSILTTPNFTPLVEKVIPFGSTKKPIFTCLIIQKGEERHFILLDQTDTEEWRTILSSGKSDIGYFLYDVGLHSIVLSNKNPEDLLQDYAFKRTIVQLKFLNGDIQYKRFELPILERWIQKAGVDKMKESFTKLYRGHPAGLEQLFSLFHR